MNLLSRLRGQLVAASGLRAALPGLAAALACAVLAGPVSAQSLSGPGVTPGKATTNSIYNHNVTWTWTPSNNHFPWYANVVTLGPEEVTRVYSDTARTQLVTDQVDIKIPQTWFGVDRYYEIWAVNGVQYPRTDNRVNSGNRRGGNRVRVTLPRDDLGNIISPVPATGDLSAIVRLGAFRVVERNIPVDPDGDGQTFFTRGSPIVAVSGVFDENGIDYWETQDQNGNPTGGLGSVLGGRPYRAGLRLPVSLPSRVKTVTLIYYVGPVTLGNMGGGFQDDDGNSVPLAACWDGDRQPQDGSLFVVSGSRGLNLLNNPRAVPGVNLYTAPNRVQHWTTRYIKRDSNGIPERIASDSDDDVVQYGAYWKVEPSDTQPRHYGDLDTASFPSTPPLVGADPFVISSNLYSDFNYPTIIEKVGPSGTTIIKLSPPGAGYVMDVRGVWLDGDSDGDGVADLAGPNYYTGGSFDTATNIVTLGTALPSSAQNVWVDYAYSSNFYRYGEVGEEDDEHKYIWGHDLLGAYPFVSFVNRAKVYNPLVAEQYIRDYYWRIDPVSGDLVVNTSARKMLKITDDAAFIDASGTTPADERLFTPFNQSAPNDGNSSHSFNFRARYYNDQNLGPNNWLPRADGRPGASGVVVYVKYDGESDFKPYGMAQENPAVNNVSRDDNSYPGDYGLGYLLRFEPNAGMGGMLLGGKKNYPTPPWTLPNNYISMPVGKHQYFFATSDDSIKDRDGNLWVNPLVKVRAQDPIDIYDYPWWTQQNPPTYRPGDLPYGIGGSGFVDSNLRDTYNYADITTYQPGPLNTGYEYDANEHPVVHALLSGIPFGQDAYGHVGSGYFLGTISPYLAGVNPVYRPVPTGMSAGFTIAGSYQTTAMGTASTKFTFKVIWQSFDPDTKIGRAPKYIKVFVNNKSTAKPTLDSDNTTVDPAAKYVGYTMSPVKANPTTADYATGLTFQYQTTLPPGPHTYYFEADAGFGPVRFPVRPDGRRLDAPPDDGGYGWWEDPYVAGDYDFADNNDYCPGPYVNNKPQLLSPSVTPSSGPYGTDFVYRVIYKDPDGQRPTQTDIIIELSPGQTVRASMQREDPNPANVDYADGEAYVFRASSLQGSVFAPGIRRYRFEFRDDWGHPQIDTNRIEGELVYAPAAVNNVIAWYDGPTISAQARPLLTAGAVSSSDGSSNPATLWTYQVTYTHGNNIAPSFVNVYTGAQRDAADPLNARTLERAKPSSARSLQVAATPVTSVSGVWANAAGTGVNYYSGGSFNPSTGVITLGVALPEPSRDVWVTYSANPIVWDDGNRMSKRDAADIIFTDGAVYQYQTTLPGPQRTGDLPITYYFTYQASDGRLLTHYDAAASGSAFALTRQPAGEGATDTGEILDHATSQNYTVYQAGHFPIVGPLPTTATSDPGVLLQPIIYKNDLQLMPGFTGTLDSAYVEDNVRVDANGLSVTVDPSVVHMVLGVYTDALMMGTDYYAGGAGGKYNSESGVIALGTQLPAGVRRVYVSYSNRGEYRVDYVNGKVIFTEPNQASDVLEMEYWWAAKGPASVGLNNPPSLSLGRWTALPVDTVPNDGVDGSSTTEFTFSVVYRDVDGQGGQAPSFVNIIIDGVVHPMTLSTSNPVYSTGATFSYTTKLSSGSHLYYFEASDGTGSAAYDADGSKSSAAEITGLVPIVGPFVNDRPVLSSGAVSPNPVDGIAAGSSATYAVTYTDADGNPPNVGYPKVWIDNPTEVDYSGKVTAVNGSTLTIGGADWAPGVLTGKLLQVTTGLVIDPETQTLRSPSAASGRIYQVLDSGRNTLVVTPTELPGETIIVGDTISVTGLVMSKQNPQQTDYRQPVPYQLVVPSMPVGTHEYHFSVVSAPTVEVVTLRAGSAEFAGPLVTSTPPDGNVAPVLAAGSVTPDRGVSNTAFTFEVAYSDADDDPPGAHDGVFGYVRLVFNDGSYPAQRMQPVGAVNSWISPVVYRVVLDDLPAGTHLFHFEASDGYRAVRYPETTAYDTAVVINSAPSLASGTVSPPNGTPDTDFTWSVVYIDADNQAPAFMRVLIDGTAHDMAKITAGSNYASGVTYRWTQNLPLGTHNFLFQASDGQPGEPVVQTTLQSGPIVQDVAGPELTDGAVSPTQGAANEQFVYSVWYRDPNNRQPASISVFIDGSATGRALFATGLPDSQGRQRYESAPVSLGGGSHTFYFEASNGLATSRLGSPSNPLVGPSVSGASLVLNVSSQSYKLGQTISVTGSLSPSSLSPAAIIITLNTPDVNRPVIQKTVTTSADGTFAADVAAADYTGTWTIRAAWNGGSGFPAQETALTSIDVGGFVFRLNAGVVDMVTLTLIPSSADPAVVFGDAATAANVQMAEWSPNLAEYLFYPARAPRAAAQLWGGAGFWVKPLVTQDVEVSGQLASQTSAYRVPLSAGWNQVGSVFVKPIQIGAMQVVYQGQTRTLADAARQGWIRDYAWGFDPAAANPGDYYFLVMAGTNRTTFDPGRGYWIRALVDCDLVLVP